MSKIGDLLHDAVERLLLRSTWSRLEGADSHDQRTLQVLAGLARLGPRSASGLGGAIGIDRTRVSRIADRLVTEGLVRREADPADFRATLLALTDRGAERVARRRTALSHRLDGLAAAWPAGLAEAFADAANRLVDDLDGTVTTEEGPRGSRPPVAQDGSRLAPDEQRIFSSVLAIVDTTRGRVSGEVHPITGLTTPDFLVLTRLDEFPGHSHSGLKALAAKMEWSASRLSHQLKRMEARGLITRVLDPASNHVVVSTTDAAQHLLEQHTALHADAVRRHLLAHITDEEAQAIIRVAERIAGG